jgi:hypothetical protein
MKLTIRAGKATLRHEAIIRALAGQLVIAQTMSDAEVAAHLASILRGKSE